MASIRQHGKEIAMLRVTDAAVTALKSVVLGGGEPLQQGDPAPAIRIEPAAAGDGRQALTLQPVMGPAPGDAPAQAADIDVFVAPEVAGALDAATLDVRATPEGPEIFLREQADEA
jgi:hypothetical protein